MSKLNKIILAALLVVTLVACVSPAEQTVEDPFITTPPALTMTPSPTLTPTATLPPPPELLVSEGDYALFVGDFDTALTIFQDALTRSTDAEISAQAQLGLGQAYLNQGEVSTALNHFREAALALDPVTAARAQYMLGSTYTRLERFDDALAAYQAYLDLRPGLIDTRLHELRGDLFTTLGDHTAAIASYQEAYLADPSSGNDALAVKVARAYQSSGDQETALMLYRDIYNTASSDYTKAQMALLIGQIHLGREENEDAYAILQESVNRFPFAYDAYTALLILVDNGVPVNEYDRGLVNYYVGNYVLAVEAINRFLAEAPEAFSDAALYHKALATRALGGEGQYKAAIALWEELIESYPTSTYYVDAWQSIEYTLWAFLADHEATAQRSLDFVAQRPEAPEAPDFLFLAGRAYERADRLQEAADVWARIAGEYPASSETFRATYFAGIAFVRLGNWSDAQALFSRALVLTAEAAEVAAAHLWIGKCQEAQGEISAALDSWKLAQTANPFGHYSIRAEDLLIGQEAFTKPESYTLDPDLSPYRAKAEAWLRETFNLPAEINLESPGMLAYDPRFQRGLEFWALGDYPAGRSEFESMRLEYAEDPAQTFRLIPALVEVGLYRSGLVASTQLLRLAGLERGDALSAPEFFSRVRFGAYYLDWLLPAAQSEGLSPLLMLSVMRQESTYEGFIRSGAGARGLMQVMPATGAEIAENLAWPEDYTVDDLDRPHVSLIFGASYLRQRRQMFDGDTFAMLAAYNGGQRYTNIWKNLTPSDDPDLFLEIVQFEETRNYIRLINEIHYIYGWLYGEPEDR